MAAPSSFRPEGADAQIGELPADLSFNLIADRSNGAEPLVGRSSGAGYPPERDHIIFGLRVLVTQGAQRVLVTVRPAVRDHTDADTGSVIGVVHEGGFSPAGSPR
ncbi:hypothetical protein Srufu_007610 [Streptomyces libani subsp. rufus]|nr:hypothetical protein Srufu_007610 [Streptomyces libani subsp. rufus]